MDDLGNRDGNQTLRDDPDASGMHFVVDEVQKGLTPLIILRVSCVESPPVERGVKLKEIADVIQLAHH